MANNINSDLDLDVILDTALIAFTELLMPLAMFSTAFQDVPLQGTNKMVVPYFPLSTVASRDYDGTYQFDDSEQDVKEVTINKRKYQGLSFTSYEKARLPKFDPETLGYLRGIKLAEDILQDILSIVLNANYGAPILTTSAADFTVDDTIDLESALTAARWPQNGRGLIIGPTYLGGLKKDMSANGGLRTFGVNPVGDAFTFPMLNNLSIAETNIIPGNGENLVGMCVYRSGILVGFAPITPADEVMEQLYDYRVVSDPATGISLEYRSWGVPGTDQVNRVIEANYGYGAGEATAIKRIVSA